MKLKWSFLSFFICFTLVALGQSNVVFNHLSIFDGLSQATVNSILQDENDVIWLGTRDGLNRYDGYSFKVYKYDLRDSQSISNNNIKVVYEDKVGDLWIGTDNGLNRFNKRTERFERFYAQTDNINALSDNSIRDIKEDAAGNLWIATSEKGMCRVVFKGKEAQRSVEKFEIYNTENNKSLLDNSIRVLLLDETGNFWLGSDGGLNLLTQKNGKFGFKAITSSDFDMSEISVNSMTEDRRGNIWMGTWGDGLVRMSNSSNRRTFKQFLPNSSPNSLGEPYIMALKTDEKGNIWVGTWTHGLHLIEQGSDGKTKFTLYEHDPLNPKSICHNSIRSIYQDKFGVVWVGTYGNGVSKFDKNATKFQHFDQDIHNPNGLKGEDVYAMSEDNYGNLWIGTWIGGLHRTKDIKSKIYQHFGKSSFPNFTNEKITNLLLDSKGRFWVGTWGQGVYQVQFTKSGEVIGFKSIDIFTEEGVKSTGFNNIRQIYEGRSGHIWLATNNGAYQLEGNQFKYVNFYRNKEDPESLGNEDIHNIFEDSQGNLWLGSAWNGLASISVSKINTNAEKLFVQSFRHQRNNLLSISSDNISVIFEDNKQQLWIGTEGSGLNHFNYDNQTFSNFTEADGLPNSAINSILEDESGYLWISTNKGISKFDADKKTFENYDVRDGLQSNEFTRMASFKTHIGWMYFGGINGLNYFHPAKIKSNQRPPNLIFTDFTVFNKSVDFRAGNKMLKQPIQFEKEVRLSYKDKVFSFEFAALNFTNPERNQYQYRLEGFNKVWQNIGNQRRVTFTNLNPGTYILKVKGANSDGVWNDTPMKIKIIISPPFWATWWFRCLALLFLGVGIFAFIRYRLQQVQKENEKLETLVQERTIKIQRQKELIEDRSKFKEQFFSNVSHELRTPLNGILGISHLLARTELNSTQRQFTDAIKSSADNLLVIINDLLDVSKLNAGQLELILKPFDTIKLFTTLYELFRPRIEEKGLKLKFDIDNNIPQYLEGDQVRFYQILINLLGNALKFTPQGEIILHIEQEEKDDGKFWLKINVEDTGIGIPADKLNKIFGNYTQVIDASGYHYEGSGLGLTIVQNLVELQKGAISVESEQHEGTIFRVSLPFAVPTDEEIDDFLLQEANQIFKQKWEGRKVLLIEDNPINQLYAKNLFIEWQLNADYAMTVKEAVEKAAAYEYDCILADVKLPDGDGLKFVRTVRKNRVHLNNQTPVIVLTAGASPQEQARAKGLDIFAYMTKPFDPDSLMRALNHVFMTNKVTKKTTEEENAEIDYDYLGHLFKLMKNKKANVLEMIETYFKQVPDFQRNIKKAIQERDYEGLYFETHTMLSSLRTIGIPELIEIVKNINDSTRQLTSFEIIEEIHDDFERQHKMHLIKLEKEAKKLKAEISELSKK